ncbi:hypothetical protein [Shewanella nanhaiensis]|uniref:Flagellar hook capping protein n=1 Tax=Shewanella nanhaiensis TaxID=2864872 RepID=A0ABS7E9S0_9GAMM|nr:hypothetical protein [Shewanella nanhaiensis]MBW8186319.1 hypothetical protein [Shewanella nanhaiensis]
MSSQIVMASSYSVKDEDSFKSALINALGSENSLQSGIQQQLNEIAKNAEKSKLKDSVISIESSIKPQSGDSDTAISLTVADDLSTLTVPQAVAMELEVTVIDTVSADSSETGVAMSVSTTKSYPLDSNTTTGIAQVVTALGLFNEGKLFDAKLTSATTKESKSTDKPAS